MDELTTEELTALAMMAFIHMYENNTLPKDKLLEDILLWFRIMTAEIESLDVESVERIDGGLH